LKVPATVFHSAGGADWRDQAMAEIELAALREFTIEDLWCVMPYRRRQNALLSGKTAVGGKPASEQMTDGMQAC
jgi:hypothetical protein